MEPSEQSVEALYATGHWLLSANRFADAAIVFRAMALAAPSDERSWLALGTCHEAVGQHRISTSLYEIASEVAAPAIRCEIARARSLRRLGLDDEAADALERARSLATDHGADDLVAVIEHDLRGAS
jgi:tetratricopeptide (TPR) repeat protein